MANFLRSHPQYQKYFQFCCEHCRGGQKFVKAEVLFHYEHDSRFRIADDTFEKLLAEVSDEDILSYKLFDRMCCKQFCAFIEYENVDIHNHTGKAALKKYLHPFILKIDDFIRELADFIHVEPKLLGFDKNFIQTEPINLTPDLTREQIIDYLHHIRNRNITAELAFYAYRDMQTCDWEPFVKASIERNPVSVEMSQDKSIDEVYQWLSQIENTSIYEGKRLAQPDEVANYLRGDGLEKAFLLANIIRQKDPQLEFQIQVDNSEVVLTARKQFIFKSGKNLKKQVQIHTDGSYATSE